LAFQNLTDKLLSCMQAPASLTKHGFEVAAAQHVIQSKPLPAAVSNLSGSPNAFRDGQSFFGKQSVRLRRTAFPIFESISGMNDS
jgi:hypothetical protein